MLDLQRIRDAPVTQSPYPFFVVPNAVLPAEARNAASDFPAIGRPGAIDIEDTQFGAAFGALLDDLKGDAFRQLVADKFDLDLDGRDIVITVRGQVRLTDGNIHTDTPSKLVTILLYFNEPGQADATSLRILKNGRNLDDYVAEIPPDLGTLVAFKVTPDCWHGHKPAPGKRLSLQMNYLSDVRTFGKHQLGRRLVTRLMRKLARFAGEM